MAQTYIDLSELSSSDFTFFGSGTPTLTFGSDPERGPIMTVPPHSSLSYRTWRFDWAGYYMSVHGNTTDYKTFPFEMLVLAQFNFSSGNSGGTTGPSPTILNNDNLMRWRISGGCGYLVRDGGSSAGWFSGPSLGVTSGTWWWIRVRMSGDTSRPTIQMNMWPEAEQEPASWQVDVLAPSTNWWTHNSLQPGFTAYAGNNAIDVAVWSIGTNGDPAPESPSTDAEIEDLTTAEITFDTHNLLWAGPTEVKEEPDVAPFTLSTHDAEVSTSFQPEVELTNTPELNLITQPADVLGTSEVQFWAPPPPSMNFQTHEAELETFINPEAFEVLAGGGGGQIFTSYRVGEWTNYPASETGLNGSRSIDDIAWSPTLGIYVAVSEIRVNSSSNGINWTERSTAGARCVVWSPQLEMFVVGNYSGGGVRTSTNGTSWTERTTPGTQVRYAAAWSPQLGLFAVVGAGGTIITSPDGINWTAQTTPGSDILEDVTWSSELGMFVVAGRAGRLITSFDGEVWTSRSTPTSNDLKVVEWAPGLNILVAAGVSSTLITSSNGINWTSRSMSWFGTGDTAQSVVWSSEYGRFILSHTAGADRGVSSSQDGVNWTSQASWGGTGQGVINSLVSKSSVEVVDLINTQIEVFNTANISLQAHTPEIEDSPELPPYPSRITAWNGQTVTLEPPSWSSTKDKHQFDIRHSVPEGGYQDGDVQLVFMSTNYAAGSAGGAFPDAPGWTIINLEHSFNTGEWINLAYRVIHGGYAAPSFGVKNTSGQNRRVTVAASVWRGIDVTDPFISNAVATFTGDRIAKSADMSQYEYQGLQIDFYVRRNPHAAPIADWVYSDGYVLDFQLRASNHHPFVAVAEKAGTHSINTAGPSFVSGFDSGIAGVSLVLRGIDTGLIPEEEGDANIYTEHAQWDARTMYPSPSLAGTTDNTWSFLDFSSTSTEMVYDEEGNYVGARVWNDWEQPGDHPYFFNTVGNSKFVPSDTTIRQRVDRYPVSEYHVPSGHIAFERSNLQMTHVQNVNDLVSSNYLRHMTGGLSPGGRFFIPVERSEEVISSDGLKVEARVRRNGSNARMVLRLRDGLDGPFIGSTITLTPSNDNEVTAQLNVPDSEIKNERPGYEWKSSNDIYLEVVEVRNMDLLWLRASEAVQYSLEKSWHDVNWAFAGNRLEGHYRGPTVRGDEAIGGWTVSMWIKPTYNYNIDQEARYLFRVGATRLRLTQEGFIEATWGRRGRDPAKLVFEPRYNLQGQPHPDNHHPIVAPHMWNHIQLHVTDTMAVVWVNDQYTWATWLDYGDEGVAFEETTNGDYISIGGKSQEHSEVWDDRWWPDRTHWPSGIPYPEDGYSPSYPGFSGEIRNVYISRTPQPGFSTTTSASIDRYRAGLGQLSKSPLRIEAHLPTITTAPFLWVKDSFNRPDAEVWGDPDWIFGYMISANARRGWVHGRPWKYMWGTPTENISQYHRIRSNRGQHSNVVPTGWASNWSRSTISAPGHVDLDVSFTLHVTPGPFTYIAGTGHPGDPQAGPFWDTPDFHINFRMRDAYSETNGLPTMAYSLRIGNGATPQDRDPATPLRLSINRRVTLWDYIAPGMHGSQVTGLGSVPIDAGGVYRVRYRMVGKVVWVKIWPTGTNEPSNWTLTAHDGNSDGPDFGVGISFVSSAASFESMGTAMGQWNVDNLLITDGRQLQPLPPPDTPDALINPGVATFDLQAHLPEVRSFHVVNDEAEVTNTPEMSLASYDAEVSLITTVASAGVGLFIARRNPTVLAVSNTDIEPDTAELSLSGHDAAVTIDSFRDVELAAITMQAYEPDILAPDAVVDVSVAANITIEGKPLGGVDNIVHPTNIALEGVDADVETELNTLLEVDVANISVDGHDAELDTVADLNIQVNKASITISAKTPTLSITRRSEYSIIPAEETTFTARDAEEMEDLDFGPMMLGDFRTIAFRVGNTGSPNTFLLSVRGNNNVIRSGVKFSTDGHTWSDDIRIRVDRNAVSEVVFMRLDVPEHAMPGDATLLLRVESVLESA